MLYKNKTNCLKCMFANCQEQTKILPEPGNNLLYSSIYARHFLLTSVTYMYVTLLTYMQQFKSHHCLYS